MARYQLAVEPREAMGTSAAEKLRRSNLIPAVVYGSGQPALPIVVERRALERALGAGSSLIDLTVGDEVKTAIVREVQNEPVKGSILHVDFYQVSMDQEVEVVVPVRLVNEDIRPNDGGVVTALLWELKVECLPANIPEAIDVDVQHLPLGGSIAVKDLVLPEGVKVLDDPEEIVVKVDEPTAPAEPEPAQAPEPGEAAEEAEDAGGEQA